MRFAKATGIAWGLVYFGIGIILSFTLGNNDFWSGAAVYLSLFLLPFPLTLVAVWFPMVAGIGLIICVLTSLTISVVVVFLSGQPPDYDFAGLCKFIAYHIPHLIFAVCYIRIGRASGDTGPDAQRPSVSEA